MDDDVQEVTARLARPSAAAEVIDVDVDVDDDVDDGAEGFAGAPSAGAAGAASAQTDEPLDQLEKALETVCQSLAALAGNVINFSYDSQHALYAKVNELVAELRSVDEKASAVDAVIPSDVIDAIDRGRNPELCTYSILEACAAANNATRGKLDVMRQFRDELDKCMEAPPGGASLNGAAPPAAPTTAAPPSTAVVAPAPAPPPVSTAPPAAPAPSNVNGF